MHRAKEPPQDVLVIVADPPVALDPESLVARIMGELNANKAARVLLLRTLLTEEFLLLPDKVEKLQQDMTQVKQDVSELQQDMTQVKQDVSELKQDVSELKQDVSELKQDVSELKQDMTQVKGSVDRLEGSVGRLERELIPLKGSHAVNGTQKGIRRLARTVNCWLTQQLNDDDLDRLLRAHDTADISRGDRESFENADFVLQAEHRDTGATHYIAVEASYTGQAHDVQRAVRNAAYLTRFTGQPAHAVVSAVQIASEVEAAVARGTVVWYQILSKDLQPR